MHRERVMLSVNNIYDLHSVCLKSSYRDKFCTDLRGCIFYQITGEILILIYCTYILETHNLTDTYKCTLPVCISSIAHSYVKNTLFSIFDFRDIHPKF